ncbi:PKD domain-containing protein [Spectribacter hydrogenooxidans]|uniref:PKD domain-containing protein n=1 Tax=Spectribacter hydrogenoxidans TaxID=3075608 RepID=A0ABU3C411_9GAMM|nr:PKD domain-containing protein [Salinisphaera sp. W335]MDT0636299.1 PKD domain-containing protein [Salinisphaera sp. W335]
MDLKRTLSITLLPLTLLVVGCGGSGGSNPDAATNEGGGDNMPPPSMNVAPVAEAADDQNVRLGDLVTLDGSASTDPDGDMLTFSWQLESPAGSEATLDQVSAAKPSFTPDTVGEYTASLTVSDGELSSEPDTVVVSVARANSAPMADAGPDQNVTTQDVVTLDGSGSMDVDADTLTYAWQFTSLPTGSGATLQDADTATPSFVADLEGDYVAELVVNDGTVSSDPDTVTITSVRANSAPIADAGTDQESLVGDRVDLDGTGSSDADGDPLSYDWTLKSQPAGSNATIRLAQTDTPSVTPDQAGDYVVELIVDDGEALSQPDSVVVTAVAPEVTLFRLPSFGEPREVGLPFSSDAQRNTTVIGSQVTTLDRFRLEAVGEAFTVIDASAVDANNVVVASFNGLQSMQRIQPDQPVEFSLESELTNGRTADITFRFEIEETGETFRARYLFTSN